MNTSYTRAWDITIGTYCDTKYCILAYWAKNRSENIAVRNNYIYFPNVIFVVLEYGIICEFQLATACLVAYQTGSSFILFGICNSATAIDILRNQSVSFQMH
jgi:hypothetical protein